MGLYAKETGGGNFSPIPAGQYIACCYAVIDEGDQYSALYNNTAHKVRIMWELPEITIQIDGKDMPRVISKEYTLSLNEKSTLRKDLDAWRGKPFTDEELKAGFDLSKLIGVHCFMQITAKTKQNGNPCASISSIMNLPKALKNEAKPLTSQPLYFNMDEPETHGVLDILPEWLLEIIEKSGTWIAKKNKDADLPDNGFYSIDESINDDDLPF